MKQVNRIQVAGLGDHHVAEIAEAFGESGVFLRKREEDGVLLFLRVFLKQFLHHLFCVLGLRLRKYDRIDEHDLAVFVFLREHRVERLRAHLAVDLYAVVARLARTERDAAAAPERRADRAVPRPAGAFLLPRLATTATNLAAVFGVGDGRAGICLHRNDDLMNQVSVPARAEHLLGERHYSHLFTLLIVYFCARPVRSRKTS